MFTYSSTHLFELEEDLTSDLHVVLLDVLQRDDDALVCAQRDSPVGVTDSEVCYLHMSSFRVHERDKVPISSTPRGLRW